MPEVKILGTGEITKALVVKGCAVSASASAAISSAGGTIHV
jgi:ribosomal protein L15